MKNVTIQISDELFNDLQSSLLSLSKSYTHNDFLRTIRVTMKLHEPIFKAMLPKEDSE